MPLTDLAVDRSSPVPLYHQVAEQIEHAIRTGELRPGDRIDNEVSLADRLGLSRPTTRQAIQTLVDKGMLVRKRGVGTQVVRAPIRRTVELTSLREDLTRAGRRPETKLLKLSRIQAEDEAAEALHVPIGAPLWQLDRLRSVDGQPLALMRNVVPVSVIDLASVDFSTTGLYEHFRVNGVHLRVAHQSIGARVVDSREGRLLGGRKGDPVLTMERISFDDQGRAVEHAVHLYRPDLYTFETTLVGR